MNNVQSGNSNFGYFETSNSQLTEEDEKKRTAQQDSDFFLTSKNIVVCEDREKKIYEKLTTLERFVIHFLNSCHDPQKRLDLQQNVKLILKESYSILLYKSDNKDEVILQLYRRMDFSKIPDQSPCKIYVNEITNLLLGEIKNYFRSCNIDIEQSFRHLTLSQMVELSFFTAFMRMHEVNQEKGVSKSGNPCWTPFNDKEMEILEKMAKKNWVSLDYFARKELFNKFDCLFKEAFNTKLNLKLNETEFNFLFQLFHMLNIVNRMDWQSIPIADTSIYQSTQAKSESFKYIYNLIRKMIVCLSPRYQEINDKLKVITKKMQLQYQKEKSLEKESSSISSKMITDTMKVWNRQGNLILNSFNNLQEIHKKSESIFNPTDSSVLQYAKISELLTAGRRVKRKLMSINDNLLKFVKHNFSADCKMRRIFETPSESLYVRGAFAEWELAIGFGATKWWKLVALKNRDAIKYPGRLTEAQRKETIKWLFQVMENNIKIRVSTDQKTINVLKGLNIFLIKKIKDNFSCWGEWVDLFLLEFDDELKRLYQNLDELKIDLTYKETYIKLVKSEFLNNDIPKKFSMIVESVSKSKALSGDRGSLEGDLSLVVQYIFEMFKLFSEPRFSFSEPSHWNEVLVDFHNNVGWGNRLKNKNKEDNTLFEVQMIECLNQLQAMSHAICGPLTDILEDLIQKPFIENWRDLIELEVGQGEGINFDELTSVKPEKETIRIRNKKISKKKIRKESKVSPPLTDSKKLELKDQKLIEFPKHTSTQILEFLNTFLRNEYKIKEDHDRLGSSNHKISRSSLAQQDQILYTHSFSCVLEMLQSNLILDKDGNVLPCGNSLISFASLLGYLGIERGLTAQILKRSNQTVLRHSLSSLFEVLNNPIDNSIIKSFDKVTLEYRYPRSESLSGNSISETWIKYLKDFIELSLESTSGVDQIEFQEVFNTLISSLVSQKPIIKSAINREQETLLIKVSQEIESKEKILHDLIKNEGNQERKEILKHLLKHTKVLSHVSLLETKFMHPRYMLILGQMMMLSAQYAIENMGLLLAMNSGLNNVVRQMGDDLHDLNAYCELYGLDEHLEENQKPWIQFLNVGKGFEYINEHSALRDTPSEAVRFLKSLHECSLASIDSESDWTSVPKVGKELKDISELKKRLVHYTHEIISVVAKLIHTLH